MKKQECEKLIESYVEWLHKGLSVEMLEGSCELTTPFLDRHNDHLQVYAVKSDDKITLSDDGYILSDLRMSGLDLNTPKRMAVLKTVLNGFGVRTEDGELLVEASPVNLGQRLHSLVQAMLAVNDMFVLAQPHVSSFFWEDVRAFLDQHEVRYNTRVKLSGRSGYDHAIDFLIPKSPTRPERLIQTLNSPNKNTIAAYLFSLGDIREGRGNGYEAHAFLNDSDQTVGGDVIEALEEYKVEPTLWSRREDRIEALIG